MHDYSSLSLELGLTLIAVPWVIFVTTSIFDLKKQTALLALELKTSREIYDLLKERL